jgi:hypothetical protein
MFRDTGVDPEAEYNDMPPAPETEAPKPDAPPAAPPAPDADDPGPEEPF